MKHHDVIINGIQYLPVNLAADSSKPPGEPDVNYRALVNDKLRDFKTFYEDEDVDVVADTDVLFLITTSHANSYFFIIAGRVQDVVKDYAYYAGDEYPLSIRLHTNKTWEEVYDLLLNEDNEEFIKTGIK